MSSALAPRGIDATAISPHDDQGPREAGHDVTARHVRADLGDDSRANGHDVSWSLVETPLGTVAIGLSDRGLARITFDADAVEPTSGLSPRRAALAVVVERALDAYLRGRRRDIDVPIDLAPARGIDAAVRTALVRIPYGTTSSYGAIAAAIGRPRAARAVGTACARNPLPLVIPCHRVIRADGAPGHYAGGDERKTWLLRLEASTGAPGPGVR